MTAATKPKPKARPVNTTDHDDLDPIWLTAGLVLVAVTCLLVWAEAPTVFPVLTGVIALSALAVVAAHRIPHRDTATPTDPTPSGRVPSHPVDDGQLRLIEEGEGRFTRATTTTEFDPPAS